MKKPITLLLMLLTVTVSWAAPHLNPGAKGVWANASSELVQTDSVLIYFTRNDSLDIKSATLIIPSRNINRTTVFTPDTILMSEGEPLNVEVDGKSITVNGEPMYLIETVNVVEPYKLFEASSSNIADCL